MLTFNDWSDQLSHLFMFYLATNVILLFLETLLIFLRKAVYFLVEMKFLLETEFSFTSEPNKSHEKSVASRRENFHTEILQCKSFV